MDRPSFFIGDDMEEDEDYAPRPTMTPQTSPGVHAVDAPMAMTTSSQNPSYYANVNDHEYTQSRRDLNQSILNDRKDNGAAVKMESDISLEGAFRATKRGCEAESEQRYKEAINFFLDGGETLILSAERESDGDIQDLILHKANEVLGWAEQLALWTDAEIRMSKLAPQDYVESLPPPRRAQSVATNVHDTESPESMLHYTAVTCQSPNDFCKDGYQLQCQYQPNLISNPALMIVITMYNEDAQELSSTLRKVCNNIQYLQDHSLPGYEGREAWKNVLVCIVSDGRTKANPETLEYLTTIGLFDEAVMGIVSTGVDVQCHLFERVIRLNKDSSKGHRPFPPLQVMFALKEHNAGKLNSHLWYFNAFCDQVQPDYTLLLDVGTMPTKSAFYRLLSTFCINPQVGGVCGEIAVDKPVRNLGNFVIAAQHYEYKVSNILDKSLESCFGYISVLPGAFSAYRYDAIKGAPLAAYFKSLIVPMAELGPFQGNMYLAEDRILAFEVLAKKNCDWTMHYVKDAIARTDVPTDLTSLIGQRRRWLNGSFFAMLFGIMQWYRVYTQSGHSFTRKMFFTVQYIYMCITTLLNWFLVSAFYLAIYYVVVAGFSDDEYGFVDLSNVSQTEKDLVSFLFNFTYGSVIVVNLILGLGNKPKNHQHVYTITAILFAIMMSIAFVVAVLIFVYADTFSAFQIGFATAILGVYFISSALHCELHHICFAFFQYALMLPTFVNVLMIYSFCNLHDLSWGTKGIDSGGQDHGAKPAGRKANYKDLIAKKKEEELRRKKEAAASENLKKRFDAFRSKLLLLWIFSQVSAIGLCIYFVPASTFLPILYVTVGFFNTFRLLGSIAYLAYMARQTLVFRTALWRGTLRKEHVAKTQKAEMERRTNHNYHMQQSIDEMSPFESPTLSGRASGNHMEYQQLSHVA